MDFFSASLTFSRVAASIETSASLKEIFLVLSEVAASYILLITCNFNRLDQRPANALLSAAKLKLSSLEEIIVSFTEKSNGFCNVLPEIVSALINAFLYTALN